jgi:hypothetical protein
MPVKNARVKAFKCAKALKAWLHIRGLPCVSTPRDSPRKTLTKTSRNAQRFTVYTLAMLAENAGVHIRAVLTGFLLADIENPTEHVA